MRRIVIIGGGFSGTLTAVHLLRGARHAQPAKPLHVTLVEREPRRVARGFAYSTPYEACLLNVPAGRMSAFDDDVEHFVRWARAQDPAVTGGAFVPRGFYGQYLESLLRDARGELPSGVTFELVRGDAVSIDGPPTDAHASVVIDAGRKLIADHVVLALGNFPPCDPACADERLLRGDRYTRNPWSPDALAEVSRDGDVLLIGTGLTMYDVALVLRDAGVRGTVHAVSRRGLVPQAHRVSATPPPHLPFPESMRMEDATPAKLLRALRREVRDAAARGDDWREVVTALRHDTPQLWQTLDPRGKRQFLRHLVPYWDTHRHRAAPQTAARVQSMRDEGRLVVRAARLVRIEQTSQAGPNPVRVTLRPRGATYVEHLDVDHVINCTGPHPNLARGGGELLASAIRAGLIVPDELGLGLRAAPDGALLRRNGSASPRLFTLGPPRRGDRWETTAVPELRVQAQSLAALLLRDS